MTAVILALVRRLVVIGAVSLMIPAAASAQAPTATEWHYGSALTLFGGGAVPNDNLRGAAGGSIAWEFTPRFSLDAMGLWFSPSHHDDVVFGSVGARYALMGGRTVAPYVSAGVGLYRASFRMDSEMRLGAYTPPANYPSTMMSWSPMQWNDAMGSTMPEFYRRRMPTGMDGRFLEGRQTFDDLAFRLGGGAEFFAGRHVSIRPEVQVIIVTDRRHAEVVPLFGLHLAYHFESHPITPNRR